MDRTIHLREHDGSLYIFVCLVEVWHAEHRLLQRSGIAGGPLYYTLWLIRFKHLVSGQLAFDLEGCNPGTCPSDTKTNANTLIFAPEHVHCAG